MAVLAILLAVSGLLSFTWWLLSHYKDDKVPTIVHLAVYFTWVVGFLGLLLLPMDLATNGGISEKSAAFYEYLAAWRLLYWISFVMSWVGLPFLVEFYQNGEFELKKRILSSMSHLIINWTVLAAGVFIVAFYLVFVDHFSLIGVLELAMTVSNMYGLFWIIILLGYGLIQVPRSFWMKLGNETQLQQLYFRAVQLQDERMEARFKYDDVVAEVREAYQRIVQAESDTIVLTAEIQYIKTCLIKVLALVENTPFTLGTRRDHGKANNWTTFSHQAPTRVELIRLHRQVRIAQLELRRCDQAFLELCITAKDLQDRKAQQMLSAYSVYPEISPLNSLRNFLLTMRAQFRRWITLALTIACALVTSSLSLCVMWGELTMGWSDLSLSVFRLLITAEQKTISSTARNATELTVALLLIYLALCCFTSLFTLQFPGKYALRAHENSTEFCLLKTSIHQCRLQFALGQNALMLFQGVGVAETTAFNALLLANSQIVHGFGRKFALYAPMAVVVLAMFTLTNGYARIMRHLGIDQYEQVIPGDLAHAAVIATGEKLVQRGQKRFVLRSFREKTISGAYSFSPAIAGTQPLLDDEHEALLDEGVV